MDKRIVTICYRNPEYPNNIWEIETTLREVDNELKEFHKAGWKAWIKMEEEAFA